jgi:cytoskeletal protein RodZ
MRLRTRYQFAMPTVGDQLRQAREEQKLTVAEVSETSKIRGDHIRALEEGNYGIFSAPVYIRGFVRTYSTLLKLDTPRVLEQLGEELAESGQVDPSFAPASRGAVDAAMFQLARFSRRLIWPAIGVGAVLALVIAAGLYWKHVKNQDPSEGIAEGIYQPPGNSGETLSVPAPH